MSEEIIWHYTSMESFLMILKTGTLRFSLATKLNDTQELTWMKTIYDEAIKNDTSLNPEKIQNLIESSDITHIADRVAPYVACFSKSPDVLSQWRSYANNGSGICIGFNKRWLLNNLDEFYGASEITVYSNKVTYLDRSLSVDELYKKVLIICNALRSQYIFFDDTRSTNYFANFFIKNSAFEEENEFRLAYMNGASNFGTKANIPVDYRTSDSGRIIPFVDIKIDKNIKCPIVSVYLGPKNDNTTEDLRQLLSVWHIDCFTEKICKSNATYR